MNQVHVACPLCSQGHVRVVCEPWRRATDPVALFGSASGERGTQRIVQCLTPSCGMIYVTPRHPDHIIKRGYAIGTDHGHDTQFQARVNTFYRSLKRHASLLPPAGRHVLDVGCAGGSFLEAAERFGYHATGLEPSEPLSRVARARGLRCLTSTLEDFSSQESFDLVTLWDVLEHVTNPRETLRLCRAHLNENGVLLINYPDVGTWQAKLAGRHFWWFLSVHLSYFDQRTIRSLLEQEGFRVLSFRPHTQWLDIGYLLEVARIYSPVLSRLLAQLTPPLFKQKSVPYYASQTTVVARRDG